MNPTWFQRAASPGVLAAIFLLLPVVSPAGGRPDLVTEFERSGGKRSPSYAETVDYVNRLDRASPWVRVTTFGTSPEGRALQLVVVDRHGRFTPERAHVPGNAVVLVQAGIHSGEIDGKDAGFLLIRAMAAEKSQASLLDHVTLLFIPIFNVDGHENSSRYNRPNQNGPEVQGFRVNAANLNLNRDYLKADTPEMCAWLKMFNTWNPDFFIDCHVTDGADYQYVVTYSAEVWQSEDDAVAQWTADNFVAPLGERMRADGLPLAPYCNFRRDNDPRSGLVGGPATPRFSTGLAATHNRPALLIETHMLKDYATRVHGTYAMLQHSLELIGGDCDHLRSVLAGADQRAATLAGQTIPVSFGTDYSDSVMFDFLGVDYHATKSDISGGMYMHFGSQPVTLHIPYFSRMRVTASAAVPAAYVIPAPWTTAIERVKVQGLRYSELAQPVSMDIATFRFSNASWKEKPFEGHHMATFTATPVTAHVTYPAGSIVVDTAQPLAKVAVNLFDPNAPDALVRWGYFDAAFEQKEYIEGYVMEGLMPKMLAADPKLAADFEAARADTAFAHSPERIRRWFYERSPYLEKTAGLYPIGHIDDRRVLETLPLRHSHS